jgi:hypothetical protein
MTGNSLKKRGGDARGDGEEPSFLPRQRRSAGGNSTKDSGRPGNIPGAAPPPPSNAPAPAPVAARASPAQVPAPPQAAQPHNSDEAGGLALDLDSEDTMAVASIDDANFSRRTALRVKASVEERPAGYTLDPLKVTILVFSELICSLNHVYLQASLYTVPYATAGTGRNFSSTDAASVNLVTKMFCAGLRRHADDCGKDISEIDRQITAFPKNFGINRSSFASNLLTKALKNRVHASQMLHLFFSVPRHSIHIPPSEREHVDAVHEMLGLADQQALLDVAHPLCQEHGASVESIRFFPAGGKDAEQTFRCTGKETIAGQFLQALGETNAFCTPISLFLLTISR